MMYLMSLLLSNGHSIVGTLVKFLNWRFGEFGKERQIKNLILSVIAARIDSAHSRAVPS